MDYIINYIKDNRTFFVLIGVVTIVYYAIFILVYGLPKSENAKKIKKHKKFTLKGFKIKNFNIFEKNNFNNPSDNGELISKSENEDWLDAYEALNEQSLLLENQREIDDFLEDQGISPPKKED